MKKKITFLKSNKDLFLSIKEKCYQVAKFWVKMVPRYFTALIEPTISQERFQPTFQSLRLHEIYLFSSTTKFRVC